MPYIDCPRCRARFHAGYIYERLEACPRCGAPLRPPRLTVAERLRRVAKRGQATEAPDWETITGSQYRARRRPS